MGLFLFGLSPKRNKKIPFARTPKVQNRTASPPLYVILEFLLLACCLSFFVFDAMAERWMHAAFSLVNAAFFFYACTYFLGWRAGFEDLQAVWHHRLRTQQVGAEPVEFAIQLLPGLHQLVHASELLARLRP